MVHTLRLARGGVESPTLASRTKKEANREASAPLHEAYELIGLSHRCCQQE